MNKLWMLLICIVFVACQKEVKKDYALFSGKVIGNADEVRIFGNDFEYKIPIAEDGTFSDTLKIDVEGYYDYNIGKEYSAIYLTKGADLNLTIDTSQFDESIAYTGVGSGENNFLAEKYLKIEEMTADMKAFFSLEPEAYKKKSKALKNEIQNLLDSKRELNVDFVQSETLSNTYTHVGRLFDYEGGHKYYTKKEELELPEDFFVEAKEIDFTDENKYQTLPQYKNLVRGYLQRSLSDLEKKYDDDTPKALQELVGGMPADSKIKEAFLQNMSFYMAYSDKLDQLYAVLKTTPNQEHQKEFERQYKIYKTLVKGKPSPSFEYENFKGGSTALGDLKGKYVYMDIWATWCGPCKKEIPFLKKLEENYHNKNIEFVSISIDRKKDYDAWKQMVEDKELGGIQLIADKDWKSDFVMNYGIKGIPRFILVDPEGKIVSANAPRPSNPKLIDLFDELEI
ncbi:TlpA family protein disulfide reductase [Aquimarina spongiae]|nr:TlpA disulfide reductase family protein [Aquimarina spongiae]